MAALIIAAAIPEWDYNTNSEWLPFPSKLAFTTFGTEPGAADRTGCPPDAPAKVLPAPAYGNGIQSIYLTAISPAFAEVVTGLIGQKAQPLIAAVEVAGATGG